MNPNKVLWEKGDFTKIASTMRDSGEELVASLGVKKGMKVLDLGCGDGNTAIPFARTGADIIGVDIAQNLVDAGNERARKEGLGNIRFFEGDAADLNGQKDGEFDLTFSIFGAMFASNPFKVANEMVRVTKKGGKIIMGNWIPNDPTLVAQILKISSAYTPPPPEGFISPMTWGVEKNVIERFGAAGIPEEKISFERALFIFRAPYSPKEYVSVFKNFYGPTMNAFDAAAKNDKSDELQKELEDLFNKHNTSASTDKTEITAAYLKVTVQC
ncbi:class I SAM-dependent methyltransferase [Pollutibacter soli]|uniref:class I SAM-dependent methyltransferase n=1 Tax=Pollutibacter soli TaxID=3034157 RepID=UPI0030136256